MNKKLRINKISTFRTMNYFQAILITLLISFYSCGIKRTDNLSAYKTDSSKITKVKSDDFPNKILEANKRFKISDKKALAMLLKIKEIYEIKNWNYNDTVTRNDLILIGVPDDSDSRWQYDMGQFLKDVDKYYALSHFWIDANTGRIQVFDSAAYGDSLVNLKDWIKMKRKNK